MIIGFLGKKGHGKDTCADYLMKNLENGAKIAFADPMKNIIKILFNMDDEQVNGNKKEIVDNNWGVTPRKVMQFVGTELFRNKISELLPEIGDSFWIKCFLTKLKDYEGKKIIISDVRFQNEVDAIKNLGGIIIKVNRNTDEITDNHLSEINIDKINNYDYLLENDGTILDLHKKLQNIINNHCV